MNVQEMVVALSNLKMTELIELTKELREKWGITDRVHPMLEPADKFVTQIEEAQGATDVVLVTAQPDKKIAAIKLIRELTNVGLAEGKRLAETPNSVIIKGAEYPVAKAAFERFEAIGVTVTLVPTT
jgi:large subunit ribosomal protein L7/L12